MNIVNILILDHHKLIREAWAFMLNSMEGYTVIAHSGDAGEAIKLALKHQPHVIITDTEFGGNGFVITEKLVKVSPFSAVIGLSPHNFPAYARRMIKAGAMGFVTKNSSGEELVQAVEAVKSGQNFISTDVRKLIERGEAKNYNTGSGFVSNRELDVMQLIRQGLSSREISVKLSISEKTVQAHRYNILKKLKLKNTAALVNYMNL